MPGWRVYKSGGWAYYELPDGIALPPRSFSHGNQRYDNYGAPHQLDVFAVDVNGRVGIFWQTDENT